MLIIGLNGSPHTQGNTAFLLKTALEAAESAGANQTELIQIGELMEHMEDPFCTDCQSPCLDIQCGNDALYEVLDKLVAADGLFLGSPVHFGTVSAQLKAFWDKTRSLRRKQALLQTPGGALSVAGARFGGQETTLRALQDMMMIHGMSIINDGSLNSQVAGHLGVSAQKPSDQDEDAIKSARVMGERIVEACSS